KAATAESEGTCRLRRTSLRRPDMQHALPVDKSVELQQPADKQEVGIAQHGQPQHAVAANQFHGRPNIDQRSEMESLRGVRRGNVADSKAPGQTDNCKTEQQRPRINFATVKSLGEKRTTHASDDD